MFIEKINQSGDTQACRRHDGERIVLLKESSVDKKSHQTPSRTTENLKKLRQKLDHNELDGFLVPHQDMFQGEYLVERDEWLNWISGFNGSAGFAIVLRDKAALFIDGRYTLQASTQVDQNYFEMGVLGKEVAWLKEEIFHMEELSSKNQSLAPIRIGFDPKIFTENDIVRFQKVCDNLVECPDFLSDLWKDRPAHPQSKLFLHSEIYAGQSSENKINVIQKNMRDNGIDGCLLPPESWSWLLNMRGEDLEFTPIAQGFAWITKDAVDLFLYNTDQHIEGVALHKIGELDIFLHQHKNLTFGYDPAQTPYAFVKIFDKRKIFRDPCLLPRACKNEIEVEGARQAHMKDGIAWLSFWQWLDIALTKEEQLTELDIVDKMLDVRRDQEGFHSLSFSTIAGSGPNGAIVHYKPEESTNRILEKNELLLIDSGAQYLEGTTDITRTLVLGEPTQEMKHHYTLVLKGHIALACAIFPKGTTGAQLDVLARNALWQEKLDFAHGTGHGVGSFLSVHEGPQRISKLGHEPLQPGMLLSNEPGYYREGHYGIRLENVVCVKEVDEKWLGFETLTLVPFDNKLIDFDQLTEAEERWLHDYHSMIVKTLGL